LRHLCLLLTVTEFPDDGYFKVAANERGAWSVHWRPTTAVLTQTDFPDRHGIVTNHRFLYLANRAFDTVKIDGPPTSRPSASAPTASSPSPIITKSTPAASCSSGAAW
jgi:hypothetical protein